MEILTQHDDSGATCLLGNPELGLTGSYFRDGRIRFDVRPTKEWEFMATGTGRTGLTVNFPDAMVIQINHDGAFDEQGRLRVLARLHLDLEGAPFVRAQRFRMEHDLRRSVIMAFAETPDGPVRVELRAHVPGDVIRIDVHDGCRTPGRLTVRLEEDASSCAVFSPEDGLCLRHKNDAAKLTLPATADPAASPTGRRDIRAWLGNRVFGLQVFPIKEKATCAEGSLRLAPAEHHILYIAGCSTPEGGVAFDRELAVRLESVRTMSGAEFIATHEAWWNTFWAQSAFEPGDTDGSMNRHKAAFDLYRYYLACCAGDSRETPVRFQIDLFRYHGRDFSWLTGMICAVEQVQSFYGAMRTGNLAPLRNLTAFYAGNLAFYRDSTRQVYGYGGARIPMWQTPQTLASGAESGPALSPMGPPKAAYNGDNPAGALWILWLLCDYVALSGDRAFAAQTLRPLAVDLLEFMRLRYPRRENGRMVIAPCNAGETWQGVRDPAEMVCAFAVALPALIALAEAHGWDDAAVTDWKEMRSAIPDIPRGIFDFQGPDVLPVIRSGDLLVPAADMSACESYVLPWSEGKSWYQLNAQQTELFAVWPAKLVLRDRVLFEPSLRSYHARLWQHKWDGWNLDVVFAACLGLHDEVARWFGPHFDHTFVLPCGLARETAPENPKAPGLPECPSLQGMGTGIIPVLEMLLQDYPDELVILPCWPPDVPVAFTLYSPYAGRVEVRYSPGKALRVKTERPIQLRSPLGECQFYMA